MCIYFGAYHQSGSVIYTTTKIFACHVKICVPSSSSTILLQQRFDPERVYKSTCLLLPPSSCSSCICSLFLLSALFPKVTRSKFNKCSVSTSAPATTPSYNKQHYSCTNNSFAKSFEAISPTTILKEFAWDHPVSSISSP